MKIIAVCPNCNEEISFDGIKLFIEGSKTDVKSKLKSYIGWSGNDTNKTKGSVSVPPPTPQEDPKELERVLDQVIKKTPQDKEMQNYLKEEQKRDISTAPKPQQFDEVVKQPQTMTVKPPPSNYDTIHIDNTKEEARDVLKREVEKQEEQSLVTAVTSQLAKLGEDIKPDLHTIAEAMAKQATESKKKGICLVCNNNPGVDGNLICQQCLTNIVKARTEEEHKKQLETARTLW